MHFGHSIIERVSIVCSLCCLSVKILKNQTMSETLQPKKFRFWIYSLIIGFVMTELITGIFLWQVGINRYQLRFIELNPLPEAPIFAAAGLLTGLLQWPLLKKYFSGSGFWKLASSLGWGICLLMMSYVYLFPSLLRSSLAMILFFCLGSLLYGVITGATLMWLIKKREK